MPQNPLENIMLRRQPQTDSDGLPVNYPKPGDPGVKDDAAIRGLMVALGLEDQAPGDPAGAIGATAGMIGGGYGARKLLKFFPKGVKAGMPEVPAGLPEGVSLPHEFHQMPAAGSLNEIARGELEKIPGLSAARPHLERPLPTGGPTNMRSGPFPTAGSAMTGSLPTPPETPPPNESMDSKMFRLIQERLYKAKLGQAPDPRVPFVPSSPPKFGPQ